MFHPYPIYWSVPHNSIDFVVWKLVLKLNLNKYFFDCFRSVHFQGSTFCNFDFYFSCREINISRFFSAAFLCSKWIICIGKEQTIQRLQKHAHTNHVNGTHTRVCIVSTQNSTVTIYQFQNAVIACNWQITLNAITTEMVQSTKNITQEEEKKSTQSERARARDIHST